MRVSLHLLIKVSVFASYFLLASVTYAQDAEKKSETTAESNTETKIENKTEAKPEASTEVKPTAADLEAAVDKKVDSDPATKKLVQNATINLETTVTGNQEQPRVLYILPWQSPQAANVDFESLDNQQKAVFGHVEREELRRELESAGEL